MPCFLDATVNKQRRDKMLPWMTWRFIHFCRSKRGVRKKIIAQFKYIFRFPSGLWIPSHTNHTHTCAYTHYLSVTPFLPCLALLSPSPKTTTAIRRQAILNHMCETHMHMPVSMSNHLPFLQPREITPLGDSLHSST